MIYLATATITPLLERTLTAALARTTAPTTYRLIVLRGPGSHGGKLDAALRRLPQDAEWFGTLDDDAAPLAPGWLPWMLGRIEAMGAPWGGIGRTLTGTPHPACALYRVDWLRTKDASFQPYVALDNSYRDVGAGFGIGTPAFIAETLPRAARPWWLRQNEYGAMASEDGRLMLAHIGGGTIGATTWRIPNWLWAVEVRRYLAPYAAAPPSRIIYAPQPGPRRGWSLRRCVREVTGR